MSAFSVVILICSATLGHADCQPDTALDVVRGPRVESAMMCAMARQTTIGATAIAPREGQEYMKVMCVTSAPNARAATRVVSSGE